MLSVLASGTLIADPVPRTSTAGKPFATALLRVAVEGDEPMVVSTIAFDANVVVALLALRKGDTLAVAGKAKVATWQKGGETKHGLSVVAEQVMTPYQLEKRRRPTRMAQPQVMLPESNSPESVATSEI